MNFLTRTGMNSLAIHAALPPTTRWERPTSLPLPSRSWLTKVLDDCNGYFQRNPYRRWFDQFHPVLTACGASYYDGSACHLDLVQWATDPARQAPQRAQARLAEAGHPALRGSARAPSTTPRARPPRAPATLAPPPSRPWRIPPGQPPSYMPGQARGNVVLGVRLSG